MKRLLTLGGAICLLTFPGLSHAAPYPVIAQDVSVCDPNSPTHCAKPDVSGNLPVTIGSGTTVVTQPTAANLNATVVGTGTFVVQNTAVTTGANVSITPTIQNASYVSGNCMGGFQTMALGTLGSVLNKIGLASQGGLVTAKQIYVFNASPAASTCTDKSTFTLNSADVSKLMYTFSLAPSTSTGTSITSGFATSLGLAVPSGGTIYAAIVETTTETPASTSDLVLTFGSF